MRNHLMQNLYRDYEKEKKLHFRCSTKRQLVGLQNVMYFPPQKLANKVRGYPIYILGHLPFYNQYGTIQPNVHRLDCRLTPDDEFSTDELHCRRLSPAWLVSPTETIDEALRLVPFPLQLRVESNVVGKSRCHIRLQKIYNSNQRISKFDR